MKKLLAIGLFVSFFCSAQEIEDLGIVSRHRAIILDTNQTDRILYKIEMRSLMPSSNRFELTTTNDVLTVDSFAAMPPGPVLLGVRYYSPDGEESDLSVYRVTVRRGPGRRPNARGVGVHSTNTTPWRTRTLESALANSKLLAPPAPPVPGGVTVTNKIDETQGTNALRLRYSPAHGTPLSARISAVAGPGRTNDTIAEGMIRYYGRGETERRNTR